MQLKYGKNTLAALWLIPLAVVAYATNVTSLFGWFVLATVALVPIVILLRLGQPRPQTMSESIHEVLK
jgi:hypothetical protein